MAVTGALLLPGLAQAALTVTPAAGATFAGNTWTLSGPGPYTISGSTTTDRVVVAAGSAQALAPWTPVLPWREGVAP
ncbi:MAG: hypothetical protein LBP99_03615 [Azoarcus sp.]|nr:hypothetical protein [Azoarcus sp.]